MIIYYKKYNKKPEAGDMKILNSGKRLFRIHTIAYGGYVVSNGRYMYDWVDEDHERAKRYLEEFEEKGLKIFSTTSKKKKKKTKVIKLNLKTKEGQAEYNRLTGNTHEFSGKVDTVSLVVTVP